VWGREGMGWGGGFIAVDLGRLPSGPRTRGAFGEGPGKGKWPGMLGREWGTSRVARLVPSSCGGSGLWWGDVEWREARLVVGACVWCSGMPGRPAATATERGVERRPPGAGGRRRGPPAVTVGRCAPGPSVRPFRLGRVVVSG
jgi:hypothetical protein